jgi:L-2-hydroxyglutarate oxidase LhgO
LIWLSPDEVSELEPNVVCSHAFLSPSTGIIDSHALLLSLNADVEAAGGWIALRTEFLEARREPTSFRVRTRAGADDTTLSCRWLVNSAGLHAVEVARHISGLAPRFIPTAWFAKGHYFAIQGRPFTRLIYPLPSEAGLGIHATVQLDGQVRFGPDVEWTDALEYDVDSRRADQFYRAIRAYWPGLPEGSLQPAYSGIRPKISGPGEPAADFVVSNPAVHGCAGLFNLFGIESPGLTAALALGEEVCEQMLRSRGV